MSTRAQTYKESGNNAFRQSKYDEAILLYTQACELDPSEYTYPLNRCMCHLKLGKHREAERDASKSLQLMPAGNTKALYRRGLARKGLGKVDQARQDFEAVLTEDPSNAAAKAELDTLPPARENVKPLKVTTQSKQVKPDAPKAADIEPKQQYEEQRSSTSLDGKQRSALKAAITPASNSNESDGLLSAVSTRRLTDTESPEILGVPITTTKRLETAKTANDFRSLRAARDTRWKAAVPLPSKAASLPVSTDKNVSSNAVNSSSAVIIQKTLHPAVVPKNMYEFEKRWTDKRDLTSRAAMILALVQQKTNLPAFFGSSLTPELLDESLVCLKEVTRQHPETRSSCIAFLEAVPQCSRFDFVSMLCANIGLVKDILGDDTRAGSILSAWGA